MLDQESATQFARQLAAHLDAGHGFRRALLSVEPDAPPWARAALTDILFAAHTPAALVRVAGAPAPAAAGEGDAAAAAAFAARRDAFPEGLRLAVEAGFREGDLVGRLRDYAAAGAHASAGARTRAARRAQSPRAFYDTLLVFAALVTILLVFIVPPMREASLALAESASGFRLPAASAALFDLSRGLRGAGGLLCLGGAAALAWAGRRRFLASGRIKALFERHGDILQPLSVAVYGLFVMTLVVVAYLPLLLGLGHLR